MPLDVYEGAGGQPYRWRVTNDAAAPETLAVSSEGYTEERGAIEGAGHTLEQLLRHHPDAPEIVSAWIAEMLDENHPIELPARTLVVIGTDVDPDDALVLAEGFHRWADETGHTTVVRRPEPSKLDKGNASITDFENPNT